MRTNTWVAGVVFLCLVLGGCVSQGKYMELEKKYVERGEALARANAILDEFNERVNFLTVDLKAKERLLEKREEELALAASVRDNVSKDIQKQLEEKLKDIEGDFAKVFKVDEGVTYNAKTGALILEGEVFFDSGSSKIKKAAEKTLLKVARILLDKNGMIQVMGHTDSDPVVKAKGSFPHGNIQLSGARAMNVLLFLEKKGKIPAKRMSFAGCGPHQPCASNKTKDGKRKNRRVEILVKGFSD